MNKNSFFHGLLIGALSCFTIISSMGFTANDVQLKKASGEDGALRIKLCDADIRAIADYAVDDYYIIERILHCIDGSTIYDGQLTTYCDN